MLLVALIDTCRYPVDPNAPDIFHEGDETPKELRCWPFVHYIFGQMGVELDRDIHKASRHFHAVPAGGIIYPMDIVYISEHAFGERHVGIMDAPHWMWHCSEASNGVARTETTRAGWKDLKKQYFRLELFDYENQTY